MPEFCKGRSPKSHEDVNSWLDLFLHGLLSLSLVITQGRAQGTLFCKGTKKCMGEGGKDILGKLFEVCLL